MLKYSKCSIDQSKMAKEKVISKDEFFQNIFECALGNFSTMETYMGIHGLMGQIFGVNNYEELGSAYDLPTFCLTQDENIAKHHFMNGAIWYPFECVYEYALNGNGQKCCIDELTDCVDFMHILHSDHFQISSGSHEIITMALVRHALEFDPTVNYIDIKDSNYPQAIAHLADIDLRTLKNAVSAGEIEAISKNVLCASSLKKWLLSRKGFKPTFYSDQTQTYFFNSPTSFANILKISKKTLADKFDPSELINTFPNQTNIIEQLELGIFVLPIDALPLIAKTYEIPYPLLFKQVMQTYYPKEYALLTN